MKCLLSVVVNTSEVTEIVSLEISLGAWGGLMSFTFYILNMLAVVKLILVF